MKILRILAFAEGLSLLILLFIAMPFKYILDSPTMVQQVGMIHGVLFIGYSLAVFYVGMDKSWAVKLMLICFGLAILPFGTFYADKKYFRS